MEKSRSKQKICTLLFVYLQYIQTIRSGHRVSHPAHVIFNNTVFGHTQEHLQLKRVERVQTYLLQTILTC